MDGKELMVLIESNRSFEMRLGPVVTCSGRLLVGRIDRRTVKINKCDYSEDIAFLLRIIQVHPRLPRHVLDQLRPTVQPDRPDSDGLAETGVKVSLEEGGNSILLRVTLDEEDELQVMSSSSPLRYRAPSEYSRSQ
jgi:hypothetical protein